MTTNPECKLIYHLSEAMRHIGDVDFDTVERGRRLVEGDPLREQREHLDASYLAQKQGPRQTDIEIEALKHHVDELADEAARLREALTHLYWYHHEMTPVQREQFLMGALSVADPELAKAAAKVEMWRSVVEAMETSLDAVVIPDQWCEHRERFETPQRVE